MATDTEVPAGSTRQSRAGLYVGLVVVVALVVATAFFQEELGYFFDLQIWNQRAPAQTVERFLTTARSGDQQEASRYLKMSGISPLVKEGKWLGYVVPQGILSTEIRIEDLVPRSGEPKATTANFVFKGPGQARVKALGGKGKEIEYRLERAEGEWKITDVQAQREHKP